MNQFIGKDCVHSSPLVNRAFNFLYSQIYLIYYSFIHSNHIHPFIGFIYWGQCEKIFFLLACWFTIRGIWIFIFSHATWVPWLLIFASLLKSSKINHSVQSFSCQTALIKPPKFFFSHNFSLEPRGSRGALGSLYPRIAIR